MIIRHHGLMQKNFDKALKFYKLLGFEEYIEETFSADYMTKFSGGAWGETNIKKIKNEEGQVLELIVSDKFWQTYPNYLNWSHVAIQVNNCKETVDDLILLSGIQVGQIMISPTKIAKICLVRDPSGNILEIVELL